MPIMLCDSNYLENPALRDYLSKGRSYKLAISEHVLIEQHKTEPLITIRKSFKIAREYADQVLVLKSIPGFYRHPLHTGRDVKSLIDYKQSKAFPKWYDDVLNAENDPGLLAHLVERQQDSIKQIEQIRSEVAQFEPILRIMRSEFSDAELKEIRGKQLRHKETQEKLINMMVRIATALFNRMEIDERLRPKNINEAPNYYLFRYAATVVHFFMFRFVEAGNLSPKPDALVNHIIDLQLIAEATYFNGILSSDKVIVEVFPICRFLLKFMGGYVAT